MTAIPSSDIPPSATLADITSVDTSADVTLLTKEPFSPPVALNRYTPGPTYHPGASLVKQLLWYYLGSPLVQSYWLPWSTLKCHVLRWFGAKIGEGVRIKPGVRIKFPWRLTIGDHSWVGENTWIDNLAPVVIGNNVCISQGVYFCTGNHDWSQPTFDLRLGTIWANSGSWLAAKTVIGPGVIVGAGAILTVGSVATRSLQPMGIYTGHPAQWIKHRVIKETSHASHVSH